MAWNPLHVLHFIFYFDYCYKLNHFLRGLSQRMPMCFKGLANIINNSTLLDMFWQSCTSMKMFIERNAKLKMGLPTTMLSTPSTNLVRKLSEKLHFLQHTVCILCLPYPYILLNLLNWQGRLLHVAITLYFRLCQ